MGEAKSIKPIRERLKEDINLSVITETGFEEAKKITSNVKYLAYEIFLPFWIKKPKVLVVLEAEFWFMLFFIAKVKGAKTILLNGRISDKSYPSYLKFKWFYKKIFKYIDKVFCQSEIDKERFLNLGAKDIEVIGNIKLAQNIKVTKVYDKPKALIVTAGSTHEDEETLILNSFLNANLKDAKLIIAPRHPERFSDVDKLIKKTINNKNLTYSKFSQNREFNSDIILIDSLGELINIYAISDIVIIGGTFNKSVGGHNPIEPATFNTKIISGESYFNQKELYENVEGINFSTNENLTKVLSSTLEKSKVINKIDIKKIIDEIKV